ncbi:hypothetical protein ACEPPN_004109 [Leptodophora sp. 'Broadleaf-Isolate-01']
MAKIYESSVEVLDWLGPADDESDTAMEKFESVGNKAIATGIQDFRAADMANWYEPGGDERVCRIKAPLNELAVQEGLGLFDQSMVPFSKRDYWTRVWVVQEISLARTVIIVCGSKRLSFTTFAAASNFCAFARWTLRTRVTRADWLDPVTGPLLRTVNGSGHEPSAAPNVLIGARRRYHLETGEEESLRSLLQRTCILRSAGIPLKATNARDKIYGLLGLASGSKKLGIIPDYSKSATEVYADVARAMIADGHTTILAWCQQPTGVEQFPRWVPDLSSHIREPYGEDRLAGVLDFLRGETVTNPLPNGWRDYVAPSGPFIDPALFNQRGDRTKVFIYTPLKYGYGETLAEFKDLRNLKYAARYGDKGEAMKAIKDRLGKKAGVKIIPYILVDKEKQPELMAGRLEEQLYSSTTPIVMIRAGERGD